MSTKLFSDKYQSNLADIYVRGDRGVWTPNPRGPFNPTTRPIFSSLSPVAVGGGIIEKKKKKKRALAKFKSVVMDG